MENRSNELYGFVEDSGFALYLPSDFTQKICSVNCQKDCVVLMLTVFQLLGRQEKLTWILDAYLLADAVKTAFAGSVDRYEIALAEALEAGLLLTFTEFDNPNLHYLIPATPSGTRLFNGLTSGQLSIEQVNQATPATLENRPNLFELYEKNIGVLTPMIADQLKLDEAEYPYEWIVEAIGEAVEYNARNWKYVSAILKSWKEKGRGSRDEKTEGDLEYFRRLWKEHQDGKG
ncbi:MAG TPA: DnaD domain protein [Anaerolineaceae bacterium]|nr:DnaD domain protein [Chloroflexota bacterium]HNY83505.1 DnaD domain protein [Anaerolineaceae bacterium]